MRSNAQKARDIDTIMDLYGWTEDDQPLTPQGAAGADRNATPPGAPGAADTEPTDAPPPRACPRPMPNQVWTDGLHEWSLLTVDRQRRRLVVCLIATPRRRVGVADMDEAPVLALFDWDWREDKALVDGDEAPWRP